MSPRKANRLIHEGSPYLLQHAYNPVEWYPWGPEAFEKAKREDKPLLISIGYSTCHWCHVMERESFEDPEIAALMNELVVAIKVDREERPDLDKIYMTAVSAMTGQGGWPLNVFVTPGLQPIFGGTYFPPQAKWGQPSWPEVVRHLGQGWKQPEERKKMLEAAGHMTQTLQRYVQSRPAPITLDPAWITSCYEELERSYDAARGGFGSAPKFPMPVYHHFLLRYGAEHPQSQALEMSLNTLQSMARGGLYDQLGGGFSRYSTDPYWHVPHFEKMLYDNAQLAVNYLEAFQITQDAFYATIARETLAYVQRDMTSPSGAFYSAEDADALETPEAAHRTEGAFYVWDKPEIEALLDAESAAVFCFHYGVRSEGNARVDPHGDFTRKNILYVAHPIPEVARELKLSNEEVAASLARARQTLFAARAQRSRPHLDDKVIAGWNGLMISAMAKATHVLEAPDLLTAAQQAAHALLSTHYDATRNVLFRSWRAGKRQALGISDDYAFVVQALLDLYESDSDPEWLSWAEKLNQRMLDLFYDKDKRGFYMTAQDQDAHLILRMSEDQDNVEPAASSVAVLNLIRLSWLQDSEDLASLARGILEALGETLRDSSRALPSMLSAMALLLKAPQELVIVGDPAAPLTKELRSAAQQSFHPRLRIYGISDKTRSHPFLSRFGEMASVRRQPTAFLCVNHACQAPTPSVTTLLEQMGKLDSR